MTPFELNDDDDAPGLGEPPEVAEAKRLLAEDRADAWNWLLNDPRGAVILSNILFDYCGLTASAYFTDARDHAAAEGRRAVARDILADQINLRGSDPYLRAFEHHCREMQRMRDAVERAQGKHDGTI